MKALMLHRQSSAGDNPLVMEDIPIPSPKRGEILIKVSTCGVCHTDLHIVEGDIALRKNPIVPGHEVIGYVDRIGPKVKRFKCGDRVGIPWLYSTCGKCEFCKAGMENLCERAKFTGWDVNGGYAEYIIGLEKFSYKIPGQFHDFQAAPLMCAGVVGFRALRMSGIKKGERLGLFGFGASAHVIIQIARYRGCQVYVFTRSLDHKRHAEKLGARWVGNPSDDPPHKMDACIIFAPKGEVVLDALKAVRKGGTVANSSIHMDPIPSMDYDRYLYHEKKLISVANSTRNDVVDFLKEAAVAKVKIDVMAFPYREANRALQMVKESRVNGAAVLKISD